MIIYKIVNDINNKVYIGQTIGRMSERIRQYVNEYNYTTHIRPIISAMRLYGWEYFHFEIIEDGIQTKEELDEKEKYYIKYYNSLCTQNGYNVELGGNGKGKHSEETKRKISQAQLGKLNHRYGKNGKEDAMSKPIIELTTGLIFESANLAAQYFGVNFSHVCASARGTRGSTGGLVFRYLDKDNKPVYIQNHAKIKSKETYNKVLKEYQYLLD